MAIKDTIGKGLANYLMPYMQGKGGGMPRKRLDYDEYTLQEKYLWFLGNEDLLVDFYQLKTPGYTSINTRSSFYYANVDSKIRVIHSGMPSLISQGKADLLMSGGIKEAVVTINKKGEEKEDVKQSELLEDILKDNDFKNTILPNSIITESWGEKFAIKISVDKDVSDCPIMEKYNPFNYRTVCNRDRLQEIVFINPYDEYELEEHYGFGYVEYELYRLTDQGRILVPLTECEETAELKNITFDKSLILAVEKKVAQSDYKGIIAEFDALDEAWSQLMDEIRTGRAETYIPDILTNNKQFNDFRKKYVVTGTDERENGDNKISHNQPEIRSDEYINSIIAIRNNILSNVKLNPLTIGIDDSVGANASGESIVQRETVSLRTRKAMINTWEPFLEKLYAALMNAYNWANSKAIQEYDIVVTFGEYATPSIETKIANTVKMRVADIIDDEQALKEIYGDDLSQDETDRILSNLGNLAEVMDS